MPASKMVKHILDDMKKTNEELWKKGIVRDAKGASVKQTGSDSWEISFSGKNDSGSIILDKHITATRIIEVLLEYLISFSTYLFITS